jgi:hypothetical protein
MNPIGLAVPVRRRRAAAVERLLAAALVRVVPPLRATLSTSSRPVRERAESRPDELRAGDLFRRAESRAAAESPRFVFDARPAMVTR